MFKMPHKVLLHLIPPLALSFTLQAQHPEMFMLNTGPTVTIPAGGKLDLSVVQMNAGMNPQLFNAKWTLNGTEWEHANAASGHLQQELRMGSAVYTAPQQIPRQNPVVVSVAFKLSDTSRTLVMLTCSITITDVENYFYLTGDICPGYYEFAKPPNNFMAQMMGTATYLEGELMINIQGADTHNGGKVLSMAVEIAGNSTGTFPWSAHYDKNKGTIPPSNIVTVGGMACSGSYISMDAVPHNSEKATPISLEGSTTITRYDREKKILQGYFRGRVVSNLHNQYHYANVYGRFTVHLK